MSSDVPFTFWGIFEINRKDIVIETLEWLVTTSQFSQGPEQFVGA